MTLFEVLELEGKERIVIIGYPRSGKSTLYNQLVEDGGFEGYWLGSLDSYKEHGFKRALYVLLEDIKDKHRYLVEGILGYRLLRKLTQFGWDDVKPDCILVCSNTSVVFTKHVGMRKALDTIWKSYVSLEKELPPVIDVASALHLGGWDFNPLHGLIVPNELQEK